MKLAFLILTHRNVVQVKRLVDRLNKQENTFVIHVSKTCEPGFNMQIRNAFREYKNVLFCKREDGSNFEFGITQGVLNGMELLLEKKIEFDYLSIMSGNDYPIKSNGYIEEFFKKNYGKQFLWSLAIYDYVPLALPKGSLYGEDWEGYAHPWGSVHRFIRFEKYWYSLWGERLMIIPETRFLDKSLWSVLKIFLYEMPAYYRKGTLKREFLLMTLSLKHRKKRRLPEGFTPYAGSQWFSITRDCVQHILKVHHAHPELKQFFKHTLLSDESFFTTIITHSDYKAKIAQNNYRYIRWTEEGARTHPVVQTKKDLPLLKASEKLFARKFVMEQDSEILDLIDKEILFAPSQPHAV